MTWKTIIIQLQHLQPTFFNHTPSKNYWQHIYWSPSSIKHLIMMEFWFSARYLFNSANLNKLVLSNTLYTRYDNHLLISHTHLLRHKLWMNYPIHNANEASMFFISPFIHVGCGLYCGSHDFLETWNIGVILLSTVITTALTGFLLP